MKIGIIGAGQLGAMLAQAGNELGFQFVFLDPNTTATAARFGKHIIADYSNTQAIKQLSSECSIVTYEFENVSIDALEILNHQTQVYPKADALKITRDRFTEKQLCNSLGLKTVAFAKVSDKETLLDSIDRIGLPAILKTRTMGYDGKGQLRIDTKEQAMRAFDTLACECILETLCIFDYEVSLISIASKTEIVHYKLTQNKHVNGILHFSKPIENTLLQQKAELIIEKLINHFNYIGTIAVEFFVHNGELIINEIAPRVHNSGHWTQDGALTSQFENHIRAITGLPLGDTSNICNNCCMFNLIGAIPDVTEIMKVKQAKLHHYQKEFRPGRKVGHINLVSNNNIDFAMSQLEKLIPH